MRQTQWAGYLCSRGMIGISFAPKGSEPVARPSCLAGRSLCSLFADSAGSAGKAVLTLMSDPYRLDKKFTAPWRTLVDTAWNPPRHGGKISRSG